MTTKENKVVVTDSGDVEFLVKGKKQILKSSIAALDALTRGGTRDLRHQVMTRNSDEIGRVIAAGLGKDLDDNLYEMMIQSGIIYMGDVASKFLDALDAGVKADVVSEPEIHDENTGKGKGNVTFSVGGKEYLLRYTLAAGKALTGGRNGILGRVESLLNKDGPVLAEVIAAGLELDEVTDDVRELIRRGGLEAMVNVALTFMTSISNGGEDPKAAVKKAKAKPVETVAQPEPVSEGETDPQSEA